MVNDIKLGLLAFANDGGLGAQTRRLAHILNPYRIMIINSSAFSRNVVQHFDWYKGYNAFVANGFPPHNDDVKRFLSGLTHVLVCENPYNFGLVYWGQEQGIKVYVQSNYEFCDNLSQPWLPVPDKFLMPSYWKIDEMTKRFGEDHVQYLPPPLHPDEFKIPREINMKRTDKKKRFLHIIGTAAQSDRNGTFDLLDAIKLCETDFELVIKSQHPLNMDVFLDDPRIKYEVDNIRNNYELFQDFDALILPRRWGGLSLTINEALMSGMMVITTDISPNNQWLPPEWLVTSEPKETFAARAPIDVYSVYTDRLADRIDWVAKMSLKYINREKERGFELAKREFAPENLVGKYLDLFSNG